MKKVIAVAASAALCCFALAGCASGTPTTSQSASNAQTSSAASDGAVTLDNVTIDDAAEDYYDMDDQYDRDYGDLYNDDFGDDELFDYDD